MTPGDLPIEEVKEALVESLKDLSGPLETLGEGGFKRTFKGYWRGEPAAIQVHMTYSAARLPRETEALRRVSSPHVARLIEEFSLELPSGSVPVYICEFVSGLSLGDHVASTGVADRVHLHQMASDLTEGLSAIHTARLVHRDLKPDNIIVSEDGRSVILDLGVAKHLDRTTITVTGRNPGTLGWMAPEQYSGSLRVGARTDLFALGLVLFFAATGEHPFGNGDVMAAQDRICTAPPRRLGGGFGPMADLVDDLLAQKPYNRPRNAQVVSVALAEME